MNGYNFFCLVDSPSHDYPLLHGFSHKGEGPVLAPKNLGWSTYDKARAGMFRYLSERQGVPALAVALDDFERVYAWPRQPTETLAVHGPQLAASLRTLLASGASTSLAVDNLRLTLTTIGASRQIELCSQGAGVRLAFLQRDVALFEAALELAGVSLEGSGWRADNSFRLEAVLAAPSTGAEAPRPSLQFPELVLND